MEIIKILWIIIFFFFTLILIFIWSKITLISNKIKKVSTAVDQLKDVSFFNIGEDDEIEQEDNVEQKDNKDNNVEK